LYSSAGMHKPRAPVSTLSMRDNDGKRLIAANTGKAVWPWWPHIVLDRDESCPAHPMPAEADFEGASDDDQAILVAAPNPAGRGKRPAREGRQKRTARVMASYGLWDVSLESMSLGRIFVRRKREEGGREGDGAIFVPQ
jgi:hypothetical protein